MSVFVPAGRASDLRQIAAAMRDSSRQTRALGTPKKPVQTRYPNAGLPWDKADDASLILVWSRGGTAEEAVSGLGRPIDEICRRLVLLEEAGSIREARAEFDSRARADRAVSSRAASRI